MTYLLDTNVLIYAIDKNQPDRRARASALLRRLGGSGDAVVSVQVLAEFAHTAMRRLSPPLSPARTYQQVERYEQAFRVLPLTSIVVLEAVRGVRDHQLAYYDAQIWAVARLNQVPYVLSEDFNPGAVLEGVTFVNPFGEDFELGGL